jgi:hypothetical protein
MNAEAQKLLGDTLLGMKREVIELGCRVQVLQVALAGLAQKLGIPPDRMYAALEAQAKEAVEKKLLDIGETNPRSADLLGVDDFLRKLDPPEDTK